MTIDIQTVIAALTLCGVGVAAWVQLHTRIKALEIEVTSEEVYNKKYINPIWPGGDSGVTVGIGYDLGMNNRETIIMDWTGNVNLNSVSILSNLAGITGQKAKK